MKSTQGKIKKDFEKLLKINEYTTSIVALNMAIVGKKYKETDLRIALLWLVDKNDYKWVPLDDMVKSLLSMTNEKINEEKILWPERTSTRSLRLR